MKALFVCSGNQGISPIIQAQADSLRKEGLQIDIVPIIGKGLWGYLKNISKIRKSINEIKPDIIHAHYSLCGIVASLTTRKPVITSLMGSDVKSSGLWRIIIRFFVRNVWSITIVKSEDMERTLGLISDKIHVLPNGVNIEVFKPMDKRLCRKRLEWETNKKIILFAADPKRVEKNFNLAKAAIQALDRKDIVLQVVYGISHDNMPIYINAADVLLLTSLGEGSPNVVKEAMACNLPIVSTNVGDVSYLAEGVRGFWVCESDQEKITEKLLVALSYSDSMNARQRIIDLMIDSTSIAKRLVKLYEEVVYAK